MTLFRHTRLTALLYLLASFLTLTLASCSEDEESAYPSLITEMADLPTDEDGNVMGMRTDRGTFYNITNQLHGSDSLHTYRYICGYVLTDDGKATIYALQRVLCLTDSTQHGFAHHDPISVESIWRSGGNINMHLLVKTRGLVHHWGFFRDATTTNLAGGTTHHISLYHDRNDDPEAYSEHAYITLRMDSVDATPSTADSISLSLHTYEGKRTWEWNVKE